MAPILWESLPLIMFPPPPAGGPLIPPTLPNSEPFGRQDKCLALGEGQPGEGRRELRSESDSPPTFVLRQRPFALRRQKYLQAQRINSRLKALLGKLPLLSVRLQVAWADARYVCLIVQTGILH